MTEKQFNNLVNEDIYDMVSLFIEGNNLERYYSVALFRIFSDMYEKLLEYHQEDNKHPFAGVEMAMVFYAGAESMVDELKVDHEIRELAIIFNTEMHKMMRKHQSIKNANF